ncbi:MAG: 30S ribosomal protein S3 [Candidatus Shikimatogenerans sp. AspAUS03]|uniref:Small ribosomal subunit protein uS3 n=1 Tax=Candidatus Shikimatogenerans sp. AspAUS03 TaxID=3158563 RepID=A0AAU7QSJ5_9FLAO
MSHKVNPFINRLGIIFTWKSSWIGNYKINILEDLKIRNFFNKSSFNNYIANIFIEKIVNRLNIIINTSRPAIIIGRKGVQITKLKHQVNKLLLNKYNVFIIVKEIDNSKVNSLLVAKNIASQLNNKRSYKKSIKYLINYLYKKNINGIKVKISGRLNGAEMARSESFQKGMIKLSTIRANIDYSFYEILTKYGIISLKVWVMKGELIRFN